MVQNAVVSFDFKILKSSLSLEQNDSVGWFSTE